MEISIKHYSDLSPNEFHDMIALRISVFVVEQNCPYQELDGLDKDAFHLIAQEENAIIGTLRILKAGIVYPEIAIGRVASATNSRDKKLGHLMMKEAMLFLESNFPSSAVRISAQTHLCNFYRKYGFVETGKNYLEDGIPHSEMICSNNQNFNHL